MYAVFYYLQQNYNRYRKFGQSTLNILKEFKDIIRPTISNNISKFFDENFKNLNFKNVYFSYEKNKEVLKNLNFEILHGQIVGISGESGSGKSTLLDLVSGLIKEDSGQILVNGKENVTISNGWQKK